jgi:hypothetical protein
MVAGMAPSIIFPPSILILRDEHAELPAVALETPAGDNPGARAPVEAISMTSTPLARGLHATRARLCAAALERDITLFVSTDWGALVALNERYRDVWFELLPKPTSAPCFWIGASDAAGKVVATHGVVLIDCTARSFGERIVDLSAFHDPGQAPPDEWGFCASGAALETRGAVAWIVAGWNRPDWRGQGLFHLLGAVARLVAWERYRPRWVVGLVDPETVPVWAGRCASRALLERRASLLYHQKGVGRLPLHFMRWSRAAVLFDLWVRSDPSERCSTAPSLTHGQDEAGIGLIGA